MQAFDHNRRIDGTICRQFQSSCFQKIERSKMQNTAQGRDLEKWYTFNCFKGWGNKGCNIFYWRKRGQDVSSKKKGNPIV